ncbi:MAG: SDR family oxidoreductase [Pseudomonadaceae bacterium]|nr:SDR family oxidoreductase [Pseudomonadaceae bacterium]
MPLNQRVILLTGATGGIGQALALALADAGHTLILSARSGDKLQQLADNLPAQSIVTTALADLTLPADLDNLAQTAAQKGIDTLINLSGANQFALLENTEAATLTNMVQLNLLAPMQLTRLLLPHLSKKPHGMIVNVGSVFGTIGHPAYTAYCASKFGLRGFTEALRREVKNKPIDVIYFAPRTTSTAMNSAAANQLNTALGNASDTPEYVAQRILKSIEQKSKSTYLGWPERLFVRVNQIMPGVVDRALEKKLATIEKFARTT